LNLKSIVIMKRAKIMLTAIALFAVVGGALAYKTKSAPRAWCIDEPANPGICSVLANVNLSTTVAPAGFNALLRNPVGGACPALACQPIRVTTAQ
jgi:hypothetical protein